MVSFYALLVQFLCWSCDQKSGNRLHHACTKGSESHMESGWLFQLACYMFGTTAELSMLFQVLGLWFMHRHLKEMFILSISLIITGIYKKVRKNDIRNVYPYLASFLTCHPYVHLFAFLIFLYRL